jgi:hypothetical protein
LFSFVFGESVLSLSRFQQSALALSIVGIHFASNASPFAEVTPYGFIQLNTTYENSAANGNAAYSNLAKQPADSVHSGGLYATARASRLGLKGLLSDNTTRFQLEADFGGSPVGTVDGKPNAATALQLRHAFIQNGKWLVGQTTTNFYDAYSAIDTIDTGAPLTSSAIRQAQVRYQLFGNDDNAVNVALEAPTSYVRWDTKTNASSISNGHGTRPDFTFNWTHKPMWGTLTLSAMKNQYVYDVNGADQTADGYLLGVSGSYKLPTGRLVGGLTKGNGAGRYQWGSFSQALSFNGTTLNTAPTVAQWVGYQHKLSDTLRANAAYSVITFDNIGYNSVDTNALNNKQLRQYLINAFYKATSSVEVGAEWLGGQRTVLQATGGQSVNHENRVNLQVRASF